MNDNACCDHCGESFPSGQLTTVSGQDLCPACLETETVLCRECGERILSSDNAGTDIHALCQPCFDRYYTNCSRCGALLRWSNACYLDGDDDEESPYCDSCYHILSDTSIHDYYYKPAPIFYGSGPRYFGVELEIDEAGEISANADKLLSIANAKNPLAYAKHDGSLNEGFEIVTHPMSLDYHLREMPWKAVCQKAIDLGYASHQARTCGLHIHVSRAAFGATEADQDRVIARILFFFEKFWEELLKFSRRTRRQLDQWATRYGYREHPGDILKRAKEGHAGRYTCVNLTNTDTVEFRMFRGTLKVNTLIATLQLVDRICDVALSLTDDLLKELAWTTFVAGCTQPELVQYLKERQLYINDPVHADEEV